MVFFDGGNMGFGDRIHWNSRNYFKIKAKSTLYTCTSCQGYLVYLQELAAKHGKKIVFEITSPSWIRNMKKAEKEFKKL